jgi:predicted ATPase
MQLTRFFGRSREVETLRAWLKPDGPSIRDLAGDDRPRLVTVTGAGGAGKTRLAVEAASVLGAEYGGKVYFVGLAEIPDPGLLSYRLCHALNLHVAEGAEPIEYLASRREEGPVLLVLDNFEHLLRDDDTGPKTDSPIGSAAVAWVHHLLQSAPQVRCLVTSRRCLGLSGEQDLPLASLAMPNFRSTPLELSECASVQLYVDRARKVKPDFAITKNNADVVAELCRRLEGMPLAIELAAAWARSMTPARMLERLAQRLDSLAARQRDLPERHRSMRAVCEWSYALLSPELQRTFELLSVFHAGFDLGAAEAVCGPSAAEQLQQLQEHSLVILEESEYREARFRMLEALNQFAFEMHEARAEADLDRERHAAYYASLMKRRNEQNVMPREWVPLIMSEYENVRAALLWYMADDARAEAAMILAGDMLCAWKWRGENSEGLMLLRSILAHPANQEPSLHRAEALNALGSLSLNQAETAEARQCYEESLSIYRQIGTPALVAGRLYNLALAASQDGEYEVSRRLTEEALAMLGEDADPAKVASYRGHLGVLAQRANDFSLAREHLECAVAAQRRLDDMVNLSDTLCNLGNLCYREKDYDAALRYYEETLIETKDTGIAEDTLYPLCGFAAVALEIGEPERAVRLYSAFENGLAAIGIELPKEYWGPRDQAHARLRAALGDAVYKACSAEGKGWTLEQAVDYALRRTACPTRA